MSWSQSAIDSLARNYHYALQKFRTPNRAPRYLGTEVDAFDSSNLFASWDFSTQQRIAMTVSWIYSNITRIGNEVSSADFNVFKKGTNERDIDHPFEAVMQKPNEFHDGINLLKHTVQGLSLDKWGAFWFIGIDKRTKEVNELWPIRVGALQPIKHKTRFISHYVYTSRKGVKTAIRPEFITWFYYAHPFDDWRSLPPLEAAFPAIEIYQGVTGAQRDIHVEGRGVPLAILSLDANISDPDYARARQQIRDDWMEKRGVAVVRAGTLDTEVLGLSSRDLQVIEAQNFTRDEIDAVFMGGIQWRRDASGQELAEINKEIKEVVIHPLHKLLAARIQLDILNPYYGEEFIGKFDDVRAQDRSIQIQERNVYWRGFTIDEARADLGLAAYKNDDFPDLGNVLVPLATNPSFVSSWYGADPIKDPEALPDEVGNTEDLLDPEAQVNQLADGEKYFDIAKAATEGMYRELKNYKKVLLRIWREHEDFHKLEDRVFATDIVPQETMDNIKAQFVGVESEDDIHRIFKGWFD